MRVIPTVSFVFAAFASMSVSTYGQTAACCLGDQCQLLEQPACVEQGGDWLGALEPPILDCSGDPCATGACCTGHELCDDNDGAGITFAECQTVPPYWLPGYYHGGLTCTDVACLVCGFEDSDHCQLWTGDYMFMSDRTYGRRSADDFSAPPGGGTINRVCWWFGYLSTPEDECRENPPDDDIEIRFYEDAFGLPGTELDNSPGANVTWDVRAAFPSSIFWRYSAPLDLGVQIEDGGCYWIEITSLGRSIYSFCSVYWLESSGGNSHMMYDWDGGYGLEDTHRGDLTFCLDIGITPAVVPGVDGGCGDLPVACCTRDHTCDDDYEHLGRLSACAAEGYKYYPHSACVDIECPYPRNDNCADDHPSMNVCAKTCVHPTDSALSSHRNCIGSEECEPPQVCTDLAPNSDSGYCSNNDLLHDGPICSISNGDCYDGSPCTPWTYGDVYRCKASVDNELATTDGPDAWVGNCFGRFHADVWYKITAPCSGEMVIDMCAAEYKYDSILAVFGDHTASPACPGESNADLLVCNDDFCPVGASTSGIQTEVNEGGVYLLRIGGYAVDDTLVTASQGTSEMNIGFLCRLLSPLFPSDSTHTATKNRYLTIDASANRLTPVAYEVTLAAMNRCSGDDRRACVDDADCPGVCENNHDLQCVDDEICGGGSCIPTGPCVAHDSVGSSWWIDVPYKKTCFPQDDCVGHWFANLVDEQPPTRVWTEETLHVTDCEVVPAAAYAIRACSSDGVTCSFHRTIRTTDKPQVHYGDVVGPVAGELFTQPDGYVNVTDVQAYLIANQGGAAAPHTTWVDLHGASGTSICEPPAVSCVIPQQILNVSDLQTIKFGFLGKTYVETPGQSDPGECP